MQTSEITTLREALQKRGSGTCWLAVAETASETFSLSLLNQFVTDQSLHSIGEDWVEVDEEQAKQHILSIMTMDLAYNWHSMEHRNAADIAVSFVSLFPKKRRMFTNLEIKYGVFNEDIYKYVSGGSSLTDDVFDTGIVIYTSTRIGFLWVSDND